MSADVLHKSAKTRALLDAARDKIAKRAVSSRVQKDQRAMIAQRNDLPPGVKVVKRRKAAAPIAKSKPKPLYVCREVLNASDIIAWAKGQGIENIESAEDLHVTVAFSRAPLNWQRAGEDYYCEPYAGHGAGELAMSVSRDGVSKRIEGGPREVALLGPDKALVLRFDSISLTQRWCSLRQLGASWDYPGYQPHVTISYDPGDIDPDEIEPYTGPILLGEEDWSEISADADDEEDAREKAVEKTVKRVVKREIGQVSDQLQRLADEFTERKRA